MAQAPKLQQTQVQRLTMTPEMKLSLEILQFDCLDLGDFLAKEIEANPLLEMADVESIARPPGKQADDTGIDRDLAASVFTNDTGVEEKVFQRDYNTGFHEAGARNFSATGKGLSQNIREEKSFHDYLHDQLQFLVLEPDERLIANNLADNLDESGYLAVGLDECAKQLGCTPQDAGKVLNKLQGLEPAGLFARDLKECLTLQLKDRGIYDTGCGRLLDHLDLVAKSDLKALKTKTRLGEGAIRKLIEEIKHLDPKPGLQFASAGPVETLIPDIFVKRTKKGGWQVELNNETLPRLLVNEEYSSALNTKKLKGTEGQFLKNCHARAGWLKRALDQRARTILSVAETLVALQGEFFSKGVRYLKPLTLADIAEKTKLHESTVSRVVQNKFLSSPRGDFRLKYFFSSALRPSCGGGEGASSQTAKARISELIENEIPEKPLSDDKIAKVLKEEGIAISRRTVMKYRESLGIPSSFDRRRVTI